jgi:DNA-binding transcriptional regulator YbjK
VKDVARTRRSADQRRLEIADAGLSILAREGARRLTHRAIDSGLGFPEGTTSYYYSSRLKLLAAACERLVELDIADMHWTSELLAPEAESLDLTRFADLQADTYIDWLAPRKRERTLARCELFLEATRNEVLGKIATNSRVQFVQRLTALFKLAKARQPKKAAESLIDFGMGILFGHVVALGRPLDKNELRILVHNTIRSLAG